MIADGGLQFVYGPMLIWMAQEAHFIQSIVTFFTNARSFSSFCPMPNFALYAEPFDLLLLRFCFTNLNYYQSLLSQAINSNRKSPIFGDLTAKKPNGKYRASPSLAFRWLRLRKNLCNVFGFHWHASLLQAFTWFTPLLTFSRI